MPPPCDIADLETVLLPYNVPPKNEANTSTAQVIIVVVLFILLLLLFNTINAPYSYRRASIGLSAAARRAG